MRQPPQCDRMLFTRDMLRHASGGRNKKQILIRAYCKGIVRFAHVGGAEIAGDGATGGIRWEASEPWRSESIRVPAQARVHTNREARKPEDNWILTACTSSSRVRCARFLYNTHESASGFCFRYSLHNVPYLSLRASDWVQQLERLQAQCLREVYGRYQ